VIKNKPSSRRSRMWDRNSKTSTWSAFSHDYSRFQWTWAHCRSSKDETLPIHTLSCI